MISPYVYPGREEVKIRQLSPEVIYDKVLSLCSAGTGLGIKDVLSFNRRREYVMARQMASYLLRHNYHMTYSAIGRRLNRHHTTIIYNIQQHLNDYDTDTKYRDIFNSIFNTLV